MHPDDAHGMTIARTNPVVGDDPVTAAIMGAVRADGASGGVGPDDAPEPVASQVWRMVFERSPVPLSLVDVHGRQLAGNEAYARLLGYEPHELGALDVRQMTRDADQAWTRTYLGRLASGQLPSYSTEKSFVRRDGSTVRARLDVRPLVVDGRCVALLGSLTPVVDRAPLGEGRLRKVVENLHDTISVVDVDGQLVETTGRYRPIMGYPVEFWEQRTIFDLLVEDDVPRVLALREEVLARPGETVSTEVSVISALGGVEVLEVHAVNLLDDPDIRGIVLTSRNVTEDRRMMEELRSSRDDAVAEAELRSRMLATVSHELRNPLHAVQGISELLATSDLPVAERQLAGTINRQIRDLTRVVDDLLTSSRLELDSVRLEEEAVDLRGLLGDVVAIARTVAVDGVDVVALIDPAIPDRLVTDPVRLRQVLSNLVGNAVKFTSAGRVRLLAAIEHGRLVIEVCDSGSGIPEAELATIFEPFRSASTAGRGAGAGLGLSIVQRIVALLGGTIDVSSTTGVGSTFRVVLPIEVAPEASSTEPGELTEPSELTEPVEPGVSVAVPAVPAPPAPAVAAGPTVLVVEDNAVNQQLARAQLRTMGYDCRVVPSGEEGLDYLATPAGAAIEVVLMDYHLPGIDGLETTRRIRAAERDGRRVAVIGVTASASLADRESCLAAGMDDYVPKPVGLADLGAAFERVAPIRRAIRDAAPQDAAPQDAAPKVAPSEPVGTPGVAQHASVDLGVLAELVDELGDRTIVADLVATFLDELDGRLAAIVEAHAADDRAQLRRLVHTITSSARLLGAASLADRCADFEEHRLDAPALLAAGDAVRTQLVTWSAT